MVTTIFGSFLLTATLCAALGINTAEQGGGRSALESDPNGWTDLLPGEDLKGWKRVTLPDNKRTDKNPWKVDAKNRLLLCAGVDIKEMFLHETPRQDGIFYVEWRFKPQQGEPPYNSGVYVRSRDDGKVWTQIQVAHLKQPPFLGDIFSDNFVNGKIERTTISGDGAKHAKPPGEWNTYEITCKGRNISVWINGHIATIWRECPVPEGLIGLQAEFFDLEFRNLKYKPTR